MENIFVEFLPPWIETGLQPAFYDKESGTVLQQTARMYARVNMLIRMFNKLSKNTKEEIERFETSVNETVENYIEQFNQLHDYVHDYFDNLDVQEEINNKLDDMLEDGTLQEIITTYIQSNVTWTFDSVASMKTATNLIDGSYAQTLGYYSKDDGGASVYKISTSTPSGYYETLDSGLYAELMLGDTVYPEQFGAKGDGTTDDSTAMEQALSYNNVSLYNGKTYIVENLSLPASTEVFELNGNFGILKIKADTTYNQMLDMSGRDCDVRNVVFDANSTAKTLVLCSNQSVANSALFDNCEFRNSAPGWGFGLSVEYYNKCTVKNCYFHDIQDFVYHIIRCAHIYICDNTFTDIGESGEITPLGEGTYTGNCQSIVITGNSFKNITGSVIYVSYGYANLVNISNNRMENCGKDGIKLQTQAKRGIVSNNILKDICAQGILITRTGLDCIVSGNIIDGCCIPGGISSGTKNSAIEIMGSHNVIVSDNIIRFVYNQDTSAIRALRASNDTNDLTNVTISNNIIDTVAGKGIACEYIKNLIIDGNNIKNTCLNNTTSKVTMQITDCIGVINNNSLNEPEYVYGVCYKTANNKIQLPKGLTPACIQSNNTVTLYANNLESPSFSSQTTAITSIDSSTNIATLAENITVDNFENPDEFYFKLDVTHIKLNYSFYLRNTAKFSLIGNYVHSTGGYNVYLNQASNVVCVPDVGANVNNFWNMNIK